MPSLPPPQTHRRRAVIVVAAPEAPSPRPRPPTAAAVSSPRAAPAVGGDTSTRRRRCGWGPVEGKEDQRDSSSLCCICCACVVGGGAGQGSSPRPSPNPRVFSRIDGMGWFERVRRLSRGSVRESCRRFVRPSGEETHGIIVVASPRSISIPQKTRRAQNLSTET